MLKFPPPKVRRKNGAYRSGLSFEPWFARGIPSRIGLLLDLSARNLERVIYFSHYIITEVNEEACNAVIQQLESELSNEIAKSKLALDNNIDAMERDQATVEEINQIRRDFETEKEQMEDALPSKIEQLKSIRKGALNRNSISRVKRTI